MGFFDKLQKPGFKAAKGKNAHIRQEITRTPTPPKASISTSQWATNRSVQVLKQAGDSRTPSPQPGGRQSQKRAASTPQRMESDSEDDGKDQDLLMPNKRMRRDSIVEPDLKRQIRDAKAWDNPNWFLDHIHAADIASIDMPTKYHVKSLYSDQNIGIVFEHPAFTNPERYQLVTPNNNDDFKPLEEMKATMETVLSNYIPRNMDDDMGRLLHHIHGIPVNYGRALKEDKLAGWRDAILTYNGTVIDYRNKGHFSRAVEEWKVIDTKVVEQILTQTYSRTVSPQVHVLRRYENGTDNVYGELLPRFVSMILKKDVKMKSDQIFVDLGSGVGNCVLQAALEIGCESWGCEMMEKACDLAELQKIEFTARCRLWGVLVGPMHLERGNFLENPTILKVLQKADVVLVNNQAFTPQLNEDLTNLFLDLKEGAKIVSLKSFVPSGHKISRKNLSAAYNHLDVEEKFYYSAHVSWTDAPGTYYVSTKDSARVKEFAELNP